MFGLFRSPPFKDPILGDLARSRGFWRGRMSVGGVRVPLAVAGARSAPDASALVAAREVPTQYPSWRKAIERALYEHYEPYAEALAAGGLLPSSEPFPKIASPSEVWPHVTVVFVSVAPLCGVLTTEVGYTVAWDEEHTLGARLHAGALVELNGSTLPS